MGCLVAVSVFSGCSADRARLYVLDHTLDPVLLASTNIPDRFKQHVASSASSRTFIPLEGRDAPVKRVVVFFGDDFDDELAERRWTPFRDSLHAVMASVEGGSGDGAEWNEYYYTLHLLRDLRANGVIAPDAYIVLAGFRGGAGQALAVGNFGGTRRFDGVLAISVIASMASAGTDDLPNQDALRLPITVLNGIGDQRVAREGSRVMEQLRASGFSRSRLVEIEGRGFPNAAAFNALQELFELLESRPGVYR